VVNILGMIIAIDPGTVQSACVEWDGTKIHQADIWPNGLLLERLSGEMGFEPILYIEMVQSFAMPVGREVFETILWIGRFYQEWTRSTLTEPKLVYRRDIKLHHCNSVKAKDSNIRQALIDKYGPPGKKANPGVTYGLKKDLWAAFAIATYASERQLQKA
jgi:hypothetical protein